MNAVGQAFATAALDSTRWIEAMESITAETGSFGAALMPVTGGPVPNNIVNQDIAEFSRMFISSDWYKRDIRVRGVPHLRHSGVFSEQHYTTPDEIARHPYFQELLGPMGLRWSAIVRMKAGADLWVVALQRSLKQGPYSDEELAKLNNLSADISAAGAVTNALGFARAEAALEAFELSGSPVILLDRNGKVLRLNQAAERMIGPDLQIVQRRVIPSCSNAAALLDRALHILLWMPPDGASAPGVVVVPRFGRAPLLAYPVRLAAVSVDPLAPCQAAIVFHDPEERPMPSHQALKACYGLTEAEAKLAVRLGTGDDLSDAADALTISKVTARNQLAAAMRKMGVNRQAELVAAVARVAPKSQLSR
jgi:DNA-binding CsgD family transcriptional regulator/PAS domain-containing protein